MVMACYLATSNEADLTHRVVRKNAKILLGASNPSPTPGRSGVWGRPLPPLGFLP